MFKEMPGPFLAPPVSFRLNLPLLPTSLLLMQTCPP
jgi:hypothetical protein